MPSRGPDRWPHAFNAVTPAIFVASLGQMAVYARTLTLIMMKPLWGLLSTKAESFSVVILLHTCVGGVGFPPRGRYARFARAAAGGRGSVRVPHAAAMLANARAAAAAMSVMLRWYSAARASLRSAARRPGCCVMML